MQLVLIRGLPGSGKSTMANVLHQAGFEWFEADTYHLNDEGEYCYDPANVKAAHEWCQRETFKALANGKRVVVSNTFTRRFEMEPYFEMAKTFGIEPNVLEAMGNWPNVHGVPAEVVEKMRQRWEKSYNANVTGPCSHGSGGQPGYGPAWDSPAPTLTAPAWVAALNSQEAGAARSLVFVIAA